MKLNVLPWFSNGLQFTCTQCGNCCTGGPGYVWISIDEIGRVAKHFNLTHRKVISKYCRKIGNRYSLKELRNLRGEYDCIFLHEEKTPYKKGQVSHTRRTCTAYPVRPLQCRTWPFWDGNLASPQAWKRASEHCPGMDQGRKHFSREQIAALRDAEDWPEST
ncbi:MAG TPA: YkgJ family cysteine cluster protein [Tepidisphaeraceae bacterium]|nr:YkgJ family cysteine cluster protein [Tepidisphaeraceae bacterium]